MGKSYLDNYKQKASVKNPREIIIFSLPKVGKTEAYTQLPGEYVILDFEKGTDFYDANKINIDSKEVFDNVCEEFATKQPKFDFIVFDTLTSFYSEIVNSLAVEEYNLNEGDNKPLDWDITQLAYGQGYALKRNILKKVLNFYRKFCKTLIISGHVADKSVSDNSGVTLTVKDLDIEGKLKNILALKTDAMAILQRTGKNENTLSFTNSIGKIGGTRVPHLAGKEIVISEKKGGKLITYWDKVFI